MIWDQVAAKVFGIVDKLIPDPAAKAAMQVELMKLSQDADFKAIDAQLAANAAQTDINKAEASNSSLFVSGPRPAIMWVCAAALAFQYLARPLIQWGFAIAHAPVPVLPGIDDNLYQLMLGMLGLGAMRTYEKVQGVATK